MRIQEAQLPGIESSWGVDVGRGQKRGTLHAVDPKSNRRKGKLPPARLPATYSPRYSGGIFHFRRDFLARSCYDI
jgi:hypothetical protein